MKQIPFFRRIEAVRPMQAAPASSPVPTPPTFSATATVRARHTLRQAVRGCRSVLLPALLLLSFSTALPTPARSATTPISSDASDAPDSGDTLGGPVVASRASTERTAAETQRLAQTNRHNDNDSDDNGSRSSHSTVQGALPVDLGTVRRLKVAGTLVQEPPLRVGNLDVLAPIVTLLPGIGTSASRAAADNVPGNINTPTEDQNFQINLPHGSPIVLTVGKSVAYIDHIEQPLRAAPLVIKGQIWLPIFSLAPLMGAAVRMETDGTLDLNPTIQSVELFPAKGYTVLTIKASAPLNPNGVLMGTLDDPPKVYLDFPGYSMGFDAFGSTTERVVGGGLAEVERVRAGLFQKFPDTTRVVLDLKSDMTGLMQPLPDKTIFALVLVKPGQSSTTAASLEPSDEVNGSPGSLRGLTIVVDAGHGGHDNGAMGAKSAEKNHNLDIARRLANQLRNRGANVLMTRDGDYFISLQGRVDFANSRKADIFFSVHINSFQPSSNGTETYYYTAQSLQLAREVHKELVKATGLKNRNVQQARFYVIRKTVMPSILTETAFISNAHEEALLMDPQFRERVARGMAQGVVNYVEKYMRPHTTNG